MVVRIFNPDNDLALAEGTFNYVPPAHIAAMRRDLELLPYWFSSGDIIVSDSQPDAHMLRLAESIGRSNDICSWKEVGSISHPSIEPWGWNKTLVRQLLKKGVDEKALPDDERLAFIRQISSKQFCIALLQRLRQFRGTCGERKIMKDTSGLPADGGFLCKPLWSSSGKGIIWCRKPLDLLTERRIANEVAKRGGVVVEPIYRKEVDFAMEFSLVEGRADFVGYSLFKTDANSVYAGNYLLHDARIVSFLCRFVSDGLLERVKSGVLAFLEEHVGGRYSGYVGVDMMVCAGGTSGFEVHPCVEMNFRCNMGVVAHHIVEGMLAQDACGFFSIMRRTSCLPLAQIIRSAEKECPPKRWEDGKLAAGFIPLTPIQADTEFVACVSVGSCADFSFTP